jgi:hypothetical protein
VLEEFLKDGLGGAFQKILTFPRFEKINKIELNFMGIKMINRAALSSTDRSIAETLRASKPIRCLVRNMYDYANIMKPPADIWTT